MAKTDITPVIVLKQLKKRFGIGDAEHYAIDGIDLTIKKGEFIAIMGPSGCGKTTLLNILGLLDGDIDGTYELSGRSIDRLSRRKQAQIRSQQIGFIFQSFNLISRLNIIDNVALPLIYKGLPRLARIKKASKILHDFHLGEREFYMPHQLSGGQVQRVAIARALVNNPSIILADEPTGNLDSHASHIIMEELSDLHKQGNTIIMVTHNPDLTTYASRVITMLDGKINTDTNDLANSPAKASKIAKAAEASTKLTEESQVPDDPSGEPKPAKKPKRTAKAKKPKNAIRSSFIALLESETVTKRILDKKSKNKSKSSEDTKSFKEDTKNTKENTKNPKDVKNRKCPEDAEDIKDTDNSLLADQNAQVDISADNPIIAIEDD